MSRDELDSFRFFAHHIELLIDEAEQSEPLIESGQHLFENYFETVNLKDIK